MVEADSHLKLVPASIVGICKVFEHIHMLSIGTCLQPYTVMAKDLGNLGHVWSQNDVITSWWWLTATSKASNIHIRHTQSV
jgi:hypothetical protein